MSTANTVAFNTIPVSIPNASGGQRLQVAAFFRKRLYVGVVASRADSANAANSARILRYYPGAGRWEVVYETTVAPPNGPQHRPHKKFLLEPGWRSMTVAPDHSGQDRLYLSLLCARSPRLIHSGDGERFEALTDSENRPFGPLYGFQGWMFGALVGAMSDGIAEKSEGGGLLYACRNPRAGNWSLASVPGFGDPHNQVIHSLQVFNGWLYVAVNNPFAGFQLWRTQAQGNPPFDWERVLDQGAQRHTLNSAVTAMAVFQDALYLGTGIPATERLPNKAAGCEMIRVFPNGCWELVMGQPRFSAIGLQVPTSTHGPGFDDSSHAVLAALASSDTLLYAATLRRAPDTIAEFRLWQTPNGENWEPLVIPPNTVPVFGDLRAMIVLPKTLLVAGTSHPNKVGGTPESLLWLARSEHAQR